MTTTAKKHPYFHLQERRKIGVWGNEVLEASDKAAVDLTLTQGSTTHLHLYGESGYDSMRSSISSIRLVVLLSFKEHREKWSSILTYLCLTGELQKSNLLERGTLVVLSFISINSIKFWSSNSYQCTKHCFACSQALK